jgi:hypothetical protein
MPTVTNDNDTIRRRLKGVLYTTEASVIAITAWSGYNMSTGHGGSMAMAMPLFLIAAAESVRVPLAGWATRVSTAGKVGACIALGAISIMSFEGLSMAFEQFINNRVVTVMHAAHAVEKDQRSVDHISEARSLADGDLAKLTAEAGTLDGQITELSKTRPPALAPSTRVCMAPVKNKKGQIISQTRIPCKDDLENNKTQRDSIKNYDERLNALLADRKSKQDMIAAAHGKVTALDSTAANDALLAAKQTLDEELQLSPMHRLAASLYRVPISAVTEEQFNAVKNYAMFGLAGAISVLTMLVSLVAHSQARVDIKPGKVRNAIRAFIARRRKPIKVTKVVEIKTPVEVNAPGKETVRIKWMAYDHATGRRINLDGKLGERVAA